MASSEPGTPQHRPVWNEGVPTGWCECGKPQGHAVEPVADRDAFGWPTKPIWPETPAGQAIVDDYYAADDPRETVGYSLGARLAQVEAEAIASERARIVAAVEAEYETLDRRFSGHYRLGFHAAVRRVLAIIDGAS